MDAAQTTVIQTQPGDSSSKQATIRRRPATKPQDSSDSLKRFVNSVNFMDATPMLQSKDDLKQQEKDRLNEEKALLKKKKVYNKAYAVPGLKGVTEEYCAAETPKLSSTMEEFGKATIYPSYRNKQDYYSSDMGPRGVSFRSISEGHILKHVQQSGDVCTTIIQKSENSVVSPSISGFVIKEDRLQNLFTKSHPEHNKVFQAHTWVADPVNNRGIIFTANSCMTPKSSALTATPEEAPEQILTLVGSNIHNSSFSRLLQSKIKPKDVKGRVLFDVLTQGDKALVAFLVKDTMISFSVINFSEQYFKEVKDNTVILNTIQEKPEQKELEGMIVKDFSFGVQSLDGIVRICVFLVHPQTEKCVCRIFEIGTNLREFSKLHTIKLAEPFISSKFSRLVLNWDYDQLVAFGMSNCDSDPRYKYLNTALKSLGRFSKNKCIKLTQTPALLSCLGTEYFVNTDPEEIPHRIELSVMDFQKPARFLFPTPNTVGEAEVGNTEAYLGKRTSCDNFGSTQTETNIPEGQEPAQPTPTETSEEKKAQQTKKPKIKGPDANSVTMEQSMNRGNWAIAITLSNSDFFGQITLGNLGIATHWRNFRDPRADLDAALDEFGFKTIQYITKTDPDTQRPVVDDGKVILVQGLRNILGLKFAQLDQPTGPEEINQVRKECLKTVNFEKFEDFLADDPPILL